MTSGWFTSAIVIAAAMMPAAPRAQQALTLAEAQAEARQHAPEAAEIQARIAGAEAVAAQAGRRWRDDPTVTSSLFRGHLVGQPDENAWSVGVSQPFDVSGSWKPRASMAAADVSRTRFEGDDGLRALDERVAIAVADVALAQRQVARSDRIAGLQRIAADAVQRQFEVGTAPQIDADAAALDLAGALVTVEQARGKLDRSRIQLARLLGRETGRDLVVEDGAEPSEPPSLPDLATLVNRDPRVRAASAELDAATFERQVFERLVPPITVGVNYGRTQHDIPPGAFSGAPLAGGLTARWTDSELVFSASVPLPLFNRQRESRARATARVLAAEARVRAARADVRHELESAWTDLQAAARALQSVANTSVILERDTTFIEQAVRAGEFDTTTRTQALRRLEEAGRRIDAALRDVRVARAAWVRRTSGLPPP